MQTGSSQGMILFEKYIEDLVRKGKVSAADAKTFLGQAGAGDTAVNGAVGTVAGKTKVG
jgi:twitching motility protein PilT